MNLAHWLKRSSHLYATQPAIAEGVHLWSTYEEFSERAARTATWLRSQDVNPGDRVALFMVNRPEYLVTMWGIWWAGAIVVPINAKLHPREAAWIVGHSGARLMFTDASRVADVNVALREDKHEARVQCSSDFMLDPTIEPSGIEPRNESDPCWLFYTSGTTGQPKGVTLAARQLRWMTLSYLASVQSVTPGEVMLHPAPLSHGGGLYHLAYVLQGGLNVLPKSQGFEAEECLALAAHWRNASFFAAPTMVRRLVDAVRRSGERPRGLSTIVYGGGPMYLSDLEEALELVGGHFAQIYGQGECPMTITVLPKASINDRSQPRYRERLASVGVPQSMMEISIRDDQGRNLPVGERGEVCVRGEAVMNGYWNDPQATAKTVKGGWLFTGDVGALDADGFLTLLDRSKDLVVSGGTNIYPREVEEALLTHPAVREVSVIGRPDADWGEVVVAYVVRQSPVDEMALDAQCLERIARFKRPKHYRFVDELPKNNYGKVLKTSLREIDSREA
ncbi:AMP-binding protein [Pseudomonas fluorescens]|nr:AMP-binding protein [Pseudomonas fluorescens]